MLAPTTELESTASAGIFVVFERHLVNIALASLNLPGGHDGLITGLNISERIRYYAELAAPDVEHHRALEELKFTSRNGGIANHLVLTVVEQVDMIGSVSFPLSCFLVELHASPFSKVVNT